MKLRMFRGSLLVVGAAAGIYAVCVLGTVATGDATECVVAGAKNAVAAMESAKGKAVVNVRRFGPDGLMAEYDTLYSFAFARGKHRVTVEITAAQTPAVPGVRAKPSGASVAVNEMAIDGDRATIFTPGKKMATIVNLKGDDASGFLAETYMRQIGSIGKNLPGHGLVDISGIPAGQGQVRTRTAIIAEEVIDGDACKIVELEQVYPGTDKSTTYRFWVDPAKGFVIPRVRVLANGGKYAAQTVVVEENTQFREYCPGVWYPTVAVEETWAQGREGVRYKNAITTISYDAASVVNGRVDEADLALTLPSGTEVRDAVLDATYRIP